MKWHVVLLGCSLFVATSYTAVAEKRADKMKTIEKTVTQKDIKMIASLPEETAAGSTIDLRIVVQNLSKGDLHYESGTPYLDYELKLLDSKGQPVPVTRFGKMAENARKAGVGARAMLKLPPGKDMKVILKLGRVFDLSMEGEYRLSITRQLNDVIILKIKTLSFRVVVDIPGP